MFKDIGECPKSIILLAVISVLIFVGIGVFVVNEMAISVSTALTPIVNQMIK